ncbi:UNVERIFIED_CONTAM: hypothetical protein FKN15_037499 [Acipenser sinensis]
MPHTASVRLHSDVSERVPPVARKRLSCTTREREYLLPSDPQRERALLHQRSRERAQHCQSPRDRAPQHQSPREREHSIVALESVQHAVAEAPIPRQQQPGSEVSQEART